MTQTKFIHRLNQLADAQHKLAGKVVALLEEAHIPAEKYADWLDEFRLDEDSRRDLADCYGQRHPVCRKISWKEVQEHLRWLYARPEKTGCCHFKVAEVDGRVYAIVIGWHTVSVDDGPDEAALLYGRQVGHSGIYPHKSHEEQRVAWKVAYQSANNVMQCDFDVDWTMPYRIDTGDVYDTIEEVYEALCPEARYCRALARSMNESAQKAVNFDLDERWHEHKKGRGK